MVLIYIKRNLFKISFFIIFVIIYLIFLIHTYIIPTKGIISPILLIGFILVIFGFYLFINLNFNTENDNKIKFKAISENLIKIILMVLMSITVFIPPITNSKSIIIWEKVSLLNYIRAYSFLIGIAFLPGAILYNIFFSKMELDKKFRVEPLIIKITVYPLLSFALLGVSVLILDQIGLNGDIIGIILFMVILGLFFIDIIIQNIQKEHVKINFEEIFISKYSLIILVISLGILLISLGVHFGTQYLIPGDSWWGVASANYIGDPDINPIERRRNFGSYPMFWGYICFGLSVLCGLPFININALLAPFCYLFITSIYLLTKAILLEYKEQYAVFSTILMSMFSGFSYNFYDLEGINPSALIIICEYSFFYKTYAYYLFFLALALFIINSKTSQINDEDSRKIFNINELRLIFLVAFFLIISFMTYMLPLLMGTIFISLYCFFSENKNKNLRHLTQYLFVITIFFITFDLITYFFLSSSIFTLYIAFSRMAFFYQILVVIPPPFFIYSILCGLILFSIFLKSLYFSFFRRKNSFLLKLKNKQGNLFKIFYITFTIFLVFEISTILTKELFLDFKLEDKIIFFYYLDKVFFSIGIIGILAVYLAIFCFKKDKKLFIILMSWIIFSFLVASFFIFLRGIESFSFFMKDINDKNIQLMNHWFSRNWLYSIFPLCILSSIGLIDISKKVNDNVKFKLVIKKKHAKNILNYLLFILLIYLSFSSVAISGMKTGDRNEKINDDDVQMIDWMSENLDINSKILLYDKDDLIRLGIMTTFSDSIYYIEDIFKSKYNYTELINKIEELKENDIEYLLLSEDYLSESSDEVFFVKYYLNPRFYNESLYETGDLELYYAPFFD